MIGLITAIISGISMSLQGVFNTRLSEKIGTWETNTFVQATGLILSLIILFFFRDLNSFSYSHVSLINDAKVRIKNYVAKEKRCLGVVFLRKVIKY